MELKARFKVIMSSEADAFLDTLRQDIKDKIVYNAVSYTHLTLPTIA